MRNNTEILQRLYEGFNARDIDATLALMHRNVQWANGIDGGYVHGHDGVREYWTAQWKAMDSRAEPLSISTRDDGVMVVSVHVSAHKYDGEKLFDMVGEHLFWIENGLISRFVIG